jgi:hypothetical protein
MPCLPLQGWQSGKVTVFEASAYNRHCESVLYNSGASDVNAPRIHQVSSHDRTMKASTPFFNVLCLDYSDGNITLGYLAVTFAGTRPY